ncbi:hypothetical protein ACFV19_27525 [Streptomyces griseoluteus]|uniref:hypothetical protein n=1 Tax=Streptomyces griseoluteus TaxID=29306 RepID=UPI0036947E8D
MATAIAHYLKKQPADLTNAGAGDVGGWGGDLMTLYGEWRRDSDSYPSGSAYVDAKFARIGVDSTFAYGDLLEDADGYLIAERVRGNKNIVEAVTDHYRGTGGLSRFRDYYYQRFGGTVGVASDTARMMLITEKDPVITLGRNTLIWGIAGYATLLPAMLPNDQLTSFVDAFGASLDSRARLEAGMRATLRANQKRNLPSI